MSIAQAVVRPVRGYVPVTLKIRTGWCQQHKNAIATRQFESSASRCASCTGRTREQGYKGQAEYDTIAAVKAREGARGRQRRHHLARKARDAGLHRADALMIGRAAQGARGSPRDWPLDLKTDAPGPTRRRITCCCSIICRPLQPSMAS